MTKEIKPFIPVWLDGAGLKAQPFRILCNLYSRRNTQTNQCNPSAATIAADCRINRDTVWKWLQWLERERWIIRVSGGGQESNQYALYHYGARTPEGAVWPAPNGVGDIPGLRPPSGNGGVAPSGKNWVAPSGNGGPRMYNKEGTQKNGNKYSSNPSRDRPLSKSDLETIIEDLDLPAGVSGHIHERMEALQWLTPEHRPFRAPSSAARFIEGLARTMEH